MRGVDPAALQQWHWWLPAWKPCGKKLDPIEGGEALTPGDSGGTLA